MNSKQRAYLRSLAHALKPTVHVGKEGVTEAALRGLEAALGTRELLKLKVLEAAPQTARETAEAVTRRLENVHLVQVIGRVIVLYRPHPDRPEIQLPR
jgi:RNA-binding protein